MGRVMAIGIQLYFQPFVTPSSDDAFADLKRAFAMFLFGLATGNTVDEASSIAFR